MIKAKKAQEEIFGFVIIVAIIILIGVVMLFFIKPAPVEQKKEAQIENLLSSMLATTSSCEKPLKEVIAMCYRNEQCLSAGACDIARKEFSEMLDAALEQGALAVGKQLKGYMLNVTIDSATLLQPLKKGSSAGNMLGSVVYIPVAGTEIAINLRFYY